MNAFKERSNWILSSDENEFQWERFLEVAEACKERREEEWLRTGVGRAYYACFLVARDYEEEFNDDRRPQLSHPKVWDFFSSKCGRVGKQIYVLGDRLKRERHNADYSRNSKKWNSVLEKCIDDSKEVITLVDGLRQKKAQ